MSSQVCDKLSNNPWQKYDTSLVPKKPGIYAIGQKVGSKATEYLYNMKRRLQEHKSPTPQQAIDNRVAGKIKQHKESELKIKYVPEKKQKSKEGAYIDCLTKKNGHRPVLNKRAGDGCKTCAGGKREVPKARSRQVQLKSNRLVERLPLDPQAVLKWKRQATLKYGHPVSPKCDRLAGYLR